MTLSVSVFGLGYVGCVSAACFARQGHSVVGVDVSAAKVDMINRGMATIVETGISELVGEMVSAGRLRATTDAEAAVHATDMSLVCVGTPSRANGSLDLSYMERVCAGIGAAMKSKSGRHTVLIRSTVLPGSTHECVVPALERASGLHAVRDFGVGMNPEFLREGTSIEDFYAPPFTVVGADDAGTGEVARALYQGIDAPFHLVSTRVAEMLKYSCNCYHGLKVAFANEIGNVCKALGVDSHEVMRLFCLDTKLNVSAAYLKPGFAFGGSCLPKDLRAVVYRARQADVDTPVLSATLVSNRRQIERAFEFVLATGKRRVGILGLAFKTGTDDLRESPMVALSELLLGKGLELRVVDHEVQSARVIGANKEFVEREIPHIWELMAPSAEDVAGWAEVVVVGSSARAFKNIGASLRPGQVIIDLARAFSASPAPGVEYVGICW